MTESGAYRNLREMWDTRWTPLTPELIAEVEKVIDEAGGIGSLGEIIGIRPRHLRRLRRGHEKAISYRLADQIFARSERMLILLELPWYTIQELQDLGIWRQPFGRSNVPEPQGEKGK